MTTWTCATCGSDHTEWFKGEPDEPMVLHCYECGADQQVYA